MDDYTNFRLLWKTARPAKKRRLADQQEGSRVSAYCTCGEFDIDTLKEATVAHEGKVWARNMCGDVLHLTNNPPGAEGPRGLLDAPPLPAEEDDEGMEPADIFCFSYGCVVFWNLAADDERTFLDMLRPFSSDSAQRVDSDFLTFRLGNESRLTGDVVTLATGCLEEKLAVSFALAQSAKMSAMEVKLEDTVEEIKEVPEIMSRTGRVPIGERELSRLTGKLFLFRSEVNLYSDILDEQPQWFWDHETFEPEFRRAAAYLEIADRVRVYNKRLDIVGELIDNLNDRLNHRNASRLEWIIIWLILIEIIMGFIPHHQVVGIVPRIVAWCAGRKAPVLIT